jgi:hypothetical protein
MIGSATRCRNFFPYFMGTNAFLSRRCCLAYARTRAGSHRGARGDEVAVAQLADSAHRSRILPAPLHRALAHPLDGHLQTKLLEEAPIHGAEPALPELAVLGEVPRCRRQLAVPEPPRLALDNEFVGELIVLTSDNDPHRTTVSSLRSTVEESTWCNRHCSPRVSFYCRNRSNHSSDG